MATRTGGPAIPATVTHHERLTVPWWWWVLTLTIVTILIAPLALDAPAPLRGAAFAVLLPVAAGLWWLGRVRITVANGELMVDDARLPVGFVADAIPLTAADRRELLGASADPLAFVVQRPWVPQAVQVVLDDPADPTPYWLISSRHPERLAAALRS